MVNQVTKVEKRVDKKGHFGESDPSNKFRRYKAKLALHYYFYDWIVMFVQFFACEN